MGAKHTPGPWYVVIDDDGNPLSGRPGIFSSDEIDCAIVHWDGFAQEYWRSARGDREIHANARLIAAAPDLLAALSECADYLDLFAEVMDGDDGQPEGNYAMILLETVKAALARAGAA